jgi:hypothetical protein
MTGCRMTDEAGYWIEVSAAEYETKSTSSSDNPYFSEPPIYCTNDSQVINLFLQPPGWLQLTTNTTGSVLDPDGVYST